jgi:ribosomal protein S18 acetylase RimI-like enzyme
MRCTIREAQPGDAPAILGLICELAGTAGETSPITENYIKQYLSSPQSTILLAQKDEEVVGLLSYSLRPDLYHAGDACLIEELVVQSDVRGQGVGSMLMTELLSHLEQVKYAEVSVAVMPENREAIRFYRRHGLTDEALFLERHFS